jgi:hypothetical protein
MIALNDGAKISNSQVETSTKILAVSEAHVIGRALKQLTVQSLTLARSVSEARVYSTGSSIPPVIVHAVMEGASLADASG